MTTLTAENRESVARLGSGITPLWELGLRLVGDRRNRPSHKVDVDAVVIGLDPGRHARGGAGRIGIGVAKRRVLGGDGILLVVPRSPRIRAGVLYAVSAADKPVRILHGLRVDVDVGPLVVGAGHHVAELRRAVGGVVLEMKTVTAAGVVGHGF